MLDQSEKPARKIVSKREYAQIQSLRAGTMLWGLFLVVAGAARLMTT
jgi:hypothetical protein